MSKALATDVAAEAKVIHRAWSFADFVFLLVVFLTTKDWLTSSVNPYPYALSAAMILPGIAAYRGYTAAVPRQLSIPLAVTLLVALACLAYDTTAVGLVAAAVSYFALWAIGRFVEARCVASATFIILAETMVADALRHYGILLVRASDTFDPWLGNGIGVSIDTTGSVASQVSFEVGIPGAMLMALLLVVVVGLGVAIALQDQGQLERNARPLMARASVSALMGVLASTTYCPIHSVSARILCAVTSWIAVVGVLTAAKPKSVASARRKLTPPPARKLALKVAVVILLTGVMCMIDEMTRLALPLATGVWDKAVKYVPLCQISQPMQDATIAMEDGHFYQEGGFDWVAMHRALRADLRAGRVEQGGSTITQQLAKNLFLTDDRTIARKLVEAAYTLELEHDLSKRRILELYLNAIDYGCGQHGVTAAAAYYFHEAPARLTLAQSAVLVGLVPHPPKTPDDLDQSRVAQGQQTALSRVAFFFPRRYSAADFAAATRTSLDRLMYPYRDAWDRGATDTIPAVWHGVGLYFFADPDEPGEIDHVSPCLKPALSAFLEGARRRFGLTGLDHLGVYNDRPMRQSKVTLSAHAFGQAIDVSGFRFVHGPELLVADHADPGVAARLAPIENLLKEHFSIVVDWRDDPLRHQTHFHCEVRGPRPGPQVIQPGADPGTTAVGPDAPVNPVTQADPGAPAASRQPVQRLRVWGRGDLVRQTTPTSCGPASLATVLTYYLGRPTTDSEMIGLSGCQGGTGSEDLERACRAIGYRATPLPNPTLAQLLLLVEASNVPAVVLWARPEGHWVVLVGRQGSDLLVSNPNHGDVRMTEAEFSRRWAGGDALLIQSTD